ncbi:MAG: OmpA family protein [Reichenbachiella sp.]|uniref:OmpA family protein n=1 Tax=Reichenbachiella sp. TaxID=2184521 RepID=UPI0032993EAD
MVTRFFYALIFVILSFQSIAQTEHIRKSIYFPGGQYYITPYQLNELHQFLDSIPELSHFNITIHSHTDNIGGVSYNQWLSQMRSATTINELIENNGIPLESIEQKDFGQFNPVYDNNTPQGRQMNRRVDILFWPISL